MNEKLSARAKNARNILYAIIGRFTHDDEFREAMRNNPAETLVTEGMQNDKQDVEALMELDPDEFDKIAGVLIDVLGKDFWAMTGVVATTCETPGGKN